ncbi:inosine triphosphate pyrophosphatase-like protein [Penicillium cosmopolitanum]|uniref:Inosine triphosphate pyrophosphatase n=1 Tax=Penicillium cosmopolitanum TaxID=1131564 RepID=A0A9W9W3B2_9EURO|nr:inosine triphosphate pyrophosphatase-like protein [Penicillium cosmopolitanum]KAJ5397676.1 inosine triphosphate pyrophosphatase-like protein [Penicillium cosmopolitanum]
MALTILDFITGNKNKLAEVRSILGDVIEVDSQTADIPEIQGTIEEVAEEKARWAAEVINGPVLVEDSALEFSALNGLPGPYIKYFLNALGLEGLNKMLDGFEDRTAEAVCTFAFCQGPGAKPILFQGRTKARIIRQCILNSNLTVFIQGTIVRPRGPVNFGWDPIFEYDGKVTFAEMTQEEKNLVSHGHKALVKLQKWLSHGQEQLVKDV